MPARHYLRPILLCVLLGALPACDPVHNENVNGHSMLQVATQMESVGNSAGAAEIYQRALQQDPENAEAMYGLGTLLESRGAIEQAETHYAQALKLQPDNRDFQLAEGRILIRLGRADAARTVYQQALSDDRHNVKALNGLGVALDYLGQHEEAEASYRKALDVDANNRAVLGNLAHSFVLSGRYDQAISLLEPFGVDPNTTPEMRQNLAEAYGLSGMFADAERMMRKDLKPADVKRNLAYYHARYARLQTHRGLMASLGSYPTKDMADAASARAADVDNSATVDVHADVASTGGTPVFMVEASGFKDADGLNAYCRNLEGQGLPCQPLTFR